MEQFLEKLFESIPKARLLRLFMQNTDKSFTLAELKKNSQLKTKAIKNGLNSLFKIGLVKRKNLILKLEQKNKASKKKARKNKKRNKNRTAEKTKKVLVYYANRDFPFFTELQNLVLKSSTFSRPKLLQKIKKLGKVKLAILSGIFLHDENARVDILLAGSDIKKKKMENFLSQIESELGRALRYTTMDIKELKYRIDMYDRFLRDILESPHEKLINKINI